MAHKAETQFWKWLRGKILAEYPEAHFSRIENTADPGIPDVSYQVGPYSGLVELKFTKSFPLGDRGLRPTQLSWFRKRLKAGGNPRLIVGTPTRVYLLTGPLVLQANAMSEELMARLAWVNLSRRAGHGEFAMLFMADGLKP